MSEPEADLDREATANRLMQRLSGFAQGIGLSGTDARQIIGHVSLMRADLGQFAKGLRATIRMDVNTAAMVDSLPLRLTPWLADHPQVDIDLR